MTDRNPDEFQGNRQENFWESKYGDNYVNRNSHYEPSTQKLIRHQFFNRFEGFDKNVSILEIGCNIGLNLQILSLMGFTNFGGIDINALAIDEAKKRLPEADLRTGTVLDMPFEDNSFDVVFSAGVLIHQNPDNSLKTVMSEMIRCSKQWIVGLEDYTENHEMITYMGAPDLYWSGPFVQTFLEVDKSLKIRSNKLVTAEEVGNHDPRKRQIYKIEL